MLIMLNKNDNCNNGGHDTDMKMVVTSDINGSDNSDDYDLDINNWL